MGSAAASDDLPGQGEGRNHSSSHSASTARFRLEFSRRLSDWLAERRPESSSGRLLDFGCADLLLGVRLDGVWTVDGYDEWDAAREAARAQQRELGAPGTVYDRLEDIPVASYDAIVLNSMFQYVPGPAAARELLAQVAPLLAPDAPVGIVITDVVSEGASQVADLRDLIGYAIEIEGRRRALTATLQGVRSGKPAKRHRLLEAELAPVASSLGLQLRRHPENLSRFTHRATFVLEPAADRSPADAPAAAPAPASTAPAPVIDETFSPADVAAYYDDWTERYEAVFGDVFQHLKAGDHDELLGHMAEVAQLVDGDRVVDGGCGVAGPARYFARRNDVAIDAVTISPVQAERARALVADAGLADQITVHVGDFHHLDAVVAPGSRDLVYFLEALVHAEDPLVALRSAYEVLAPGGRVYIKDFYRGRSDDPDAQRVIDECVEATNRICHLTIRNTDDMVRWVEEAGFEIEVSQPLATPTYSIEDGHEFCRRYGLDVAAGRDFTTTFYLDNLEIRARKPR